jgi:O-antigen/teichoic acid export membrane protein
VELGLSIDGAILGSVGASLIELAVCRRFVRPGFSLSALLRLRTLWSYAAPLLLSALALRLFDKLDLITLTALGGTPEQAGRYGAAQNLAILPSLFALSFSQLLLASLTRAYRDGDGAGPIARNAMRGVLLLVPFVALAAGAAPEIVRLVFGPAFAAAAPLLAPLLFAAVALVLGSVASSVLIAAGRPGLTLALTGPLPVVAAIGYLVVIPRAGPEGASLVTFAAATLSAIALVLAVYRSCRVLPPAAPLLQSGIVSAAVYAAAVLWPAAGVLVVLKLAVIGVGIVIAFLLTGAIRPAELTAASSWWRRDAGR